MRERFLSSSSSLLQIPVNLEKEVREKGLFVHFERERERVAMGGSMKGHSGGNRGRPYGLMLLLAFGAAFLGVMVLHKLRERRIFNLLVKEKDRDLISLHLLLQKERDYNKEVKKKNEEMRAKIYSLRTQKMELDSRVLEMQSTISSLKDEQRTIEVALEEKKNEIKLLQEKELEIDSNKENPQVISLTEILKQKEVEIEDLKHRLEYPVKVWSVSADDPSNPSVNLTATRSIAWKDKSEATGIKEEDGELHESTAGYGDSENSKRDGDGSGNESTNHPDGESSTRSEDRRENGVEFADRREMTRNQLDRLENSHEVFRDGNTGTEKSIHEVQGKKTEDSQDGEGFGRGEAKNITIATETIANNGGEVFKTRDEYSDVKGTDGKEHGISGTEQLEKLNSIGGQDLRLGVNSKGGMKLEIPDNSETGAGHRVRGKQGSASRMREKRWRILAKNRRYENGRNSENNGDASMRGRRFSKDALENEISKRHGEQQKLDESSNQNTGLKMRYESGQENADRVGLQGGEEGKDSRKEVRETVVSTDVKLLEHQNLEDAENVSVKVGNSGTNQHTERRQEMDVQYENSEKPQQTRDAVTTNTTVIVDGEDRKQKADEVGQSEEERASGIRQQTERREVDRDSEVAKVVEKHEEAEDLEVADVKEAETDMVRESRSKLEEDKEEYKEEADKKVF